VGTTTALAVGSYVDVQTIDGSGGAHSHGVTADAAWRPAYVDVIMCERA